MDPVTRGSLDPSSTTQASLGGIAGAEEVGAPDAERQAADEAAAPDPHPGVQSCLRRGARFWFLPFGSSFPFDFWLRLLSLRL